MSESEYTTQHWSVDKRVNLSHLAATISMIAALFVWGNKIDQRVTTLEANIQNNMTNMQGLNNRLNRIEDKLDRLIENSR